MRGMNDECIDLIYLDPPFNSDANYAAPIGSEAAGAEFKDTWGLSDIDLAWWGEIADQYPGLYELLNATRTIHGDSMMSYLIYMAIRMMEMKRVLKDTGSIYLHCDTTASHYLKLMMDSVFGKNWYQNQVTWKRTTSRGDGERYGRISDMLFYYAGDNATWRNQYHEDGLVVAGDRLIPLTGAGVSSGEAGEPWHGYDPAKSGKGRHWSVPKTGTYAEYIDQNIIPGYKDMKGVHERLDALDAKGLIQFSDKGTPNLFRPAEAANTGPKVNDIWTDVALQGDTTDYPTEKPIALLQRIIKASSNEGDVVLDPFCGCATACVAAEIEGRQWIGIDVSPLAYDLVKSRLEKQVNVGEGQMFGNVIHRTDIPGDRKGKKSKNIRHIRYGEQEGKCNGCLEQFPFRNMTEDHIVPQCKGGSDTDGNIQLLCAWCNSKKGGTRTHDELIAILIEEGVRK